MHDYIIIALALFLGGTVQSIGGFGAMLIAVPIVSHVVPLQTAVPLLAALGLPITLAIFYNNRHGIQWREVAFIALGSVAGIPGGLWLLRYAPPTLIMHVLGALLVSYSLYALVIEPRLLAVLREARASRPWASIVVGMAAGTLGAAFNTSGPPLIVYGDWLRWPKERFKALLQGVFLANGSLIIAGHIAAGNFNATMFPYAAAAFPGILLGLWTGHRLDHHVNPDRFRQVVLGLLLLMGLSLILR